MGEFLDEAKEERARIRKSQLYIANIWNVLMTLHHVVRLANVVSRNEQKGRISVLEKEREKTELQMLLASSAQHAGGGAGARSGGSDGSEGGPEREGPPGGEEGPQQHSREKKNPSGGSAAAAAAPSAAALPAAAVLPEAPLARADVGAASAVAPAGRGEATVVTVPTRKAVVKKDGSQNEEEEEKPKNVFGLSSFTVNDGQLLTLRAVGQ